MPKTKKNWFWGVLLIALGVLWLLSSMEIITGSWWKYFWPIVIVLIGIKMLWPVISVSGGREK